MTEKTRERDPLVTVKDLHVEFDVRDGIVHSVDGASFNIYRGQTLGIIGESGCGKSITAKAIMNMVPKPGKMRGEITFYQKSETDDGQIIIDEVRLDQTDPDGEIIRKIRGGHIAMIFQEPMSSLTPVYSAGFHLMEAIKLHRSLPTETIGGKMTGNIQKKHKVTEEEAKTIAIDMLRRVGIPNAAKRFNSYPHELSGGQRQRIMIAIALSTSPDLLIADEPTTALDVSIEAQILDLMRDLQKNDNMAIMFITHNLGVIAEIADEVVVMYMGKEVERATTIELFENPKHPYTTALLGSIPNIGEKKGKLETIAGMVPSPFNLPSGCVFHPRCPAFMPGKCDRIHPNYSEVSKDHWARCLLYDGCWPNTTEAQAIKHQASAD
jgi:peptide/nickel transport system ATP-binding protein